jgi:hypothetical protein
MRVMITHLTGSRRGERELFEDETIAIGRARQNKVRLGVNDTRASARHAELRLEKNRYHVVDVGSTNGTYVNGRRVERQRLRNGDVVSFGYGGPELRFEFFQAIPTERPSISEPHEFPARFELKWWMWGGACVFVGAAVVFLFTELVVLAIPAALAAAGLFFLALSAARVNITVGPEGVEHEGLFTTTRVAWGEIVSLESGREKTGLLRSTLCTIRGRNAVVRFSPRDYVEGYLLARLVAEGAGKEWRSSHEITASDAKPLPSTVSEEEQAPPAKATDRLRTPDAPEVPPR